MSEELRELLGTPREDTEGDLRVTADLVREAADRLDAGNFRIPKDLEVQLVEEREQGGWVKAWVWVSTVRTASVSIWQDDDCSPVDDSDDCGWKLHSFSRKHINFTHPDEFDLKSKEHEAKIKDHRLFYLSYYEHGPGTATWSLLGHSPPGADCPWDSVEFAGILEFQGTDEDLWGNETDNEKRKDISFERARSFLKYYCNWCNGNIFGYTIEFDDGEHISCGGYTDTETMAEEILAETRGVVLDWDDDYTNCESEYNDLLRKQDNE